MEDLIQTASEIADARGGHQKDEFLAKAREIAHEYQPRCTGGGILARSDGIRYHSNSCDSLTEAIASALRSAVEAERERVIAAAAKHITHLRWERGTFPDRSVWTRDEAWAAIALALESAAADLETLKNPSPD